MSAANASARKRRAPIEQNMPPPSPQNGRNTPIPGQSGTSGLTLPQVISVIDTRLIKLESFMKTSQENSNTSSSGDVASITNELLDEYNNRFEILASEIHDLKDMLLKLQAYTIDINKRLMEERIQILSDINRPTFSLNSQQNESIGDLSEILNAQDAQSVNIQDILQQNMLEEEQATNSI